MIDAVTVSIVNRCEDNSAAISCADHPGDHRRTKHISKSRYFIRDVAADNLLTMIFTCRLRTTRGCPPHEGITPGLSQVTLFTSIPG